MIAAAQRCLLLPCSSLLNLTSQAGALCGDSEQALKPCSNWWTFEMFAELTGQEMLPALEVGDGCHGIVSLV